MSIKLWGFWFALTRWVALVALAVVPTVIGVVAYRWWRGRELWSMADIPVAAEVTLCLAWLSMLTAANEILQSHLDPSVWTGLEVAAAAGLVCAIPVAFAYQEIDRMKRVFGPRKSLTA